MKRKLKWLAIVLAVSLLGFGTALLLWPRDPITADSWKQIRLGMTEKEVEDILGGPGKNLEVYQAEMQMSKHPVLSDIRLEEGNAFLAEEPSKVWIGRLGRIGIDFDKDRQVAFKAFQGFDTPHVIDRLRDWLGW